jgi:hypothetical protein
MGTALTQLKNKVLETHYTYTTQLVEKTDHSPAEKKYKVKGEGLREKGKIPFTFCLLPFTLQKFTQVGFSCTDLLSTD